MKRTKSMVVDETSVEAYELYLFASNNSEIYFRSIRPVVASMKKKMVKGTFDHEKAIDAFYHVSTFASKLYEKEFGYRFGVAARFTAAAFLLDSFMDEIMWGVEND